MKYSENVINTIYSCILGVISFIEGNIVGMISNRLDVIHNVIEIGKDIYREITSNIKATSNSPNFIQFMERIKSSRRASFNALIADVSWIMDRIDLIKNWIRIANREKIGFTQIPISIKNCSLGVSYTRKFNLERIECKGKKVTNTSVTKTIIHAK
ncbi:hypothetical protein A3Q56_06100 [Intoshia linei]|uniref:Uncharacterized protein n=1 Tax=Intoshia linei TaxID=1819745 RepID=A0A177AW07_9BILA|nr:hypothetical protein A3Q56_06100 [Intoshia linei]